MHPSSLRDPVHGFIPFDEGERTLVDCPAVQRLRWVHQLATTWLVYPGATHRRFEHSLGVVELAERVFHTVTRPENLGTEAAALLGQDFLDRADYWRRCLRAAALLHDVGHLPFSHAAEAELLPDGWDHDRLTAQVVRSRHVAPVLAAMDPPLAVEDVVKLAVGPRKYLPPARAAGGTAAGGGTDWTPGERLLAQVITGDAFGADRMDYLLRDSLHLGVAYGRFDRDRLVATLRVLPWPDEQGRPQPCLGVDQGGLHAAEALLTARYFMYTQVYFHPVRRACDIHLLDYLRERLPGGRFPTDPDAHLASADEEWIAELRRASADPAAPGHLHADRLLRRRHFRVLYQANPEDLGRHRGAGGAVWRAAADRYGRENLRREQDEETGAPEDFPVLARDGRVLPARELSGLLPTLPRAAFDHVLIRPDLAGEARAWLGRELPAILEQDGGIAPHREGRPAP